MATGGVSWVLRSLNGVRYGGDYVLWVLNSPAIGEKRAFVCSYRDGLTQGDVGSRSKTRDSRILV